MADFFNNEIAAREVEKLVDEIPFSTHMLERGVNLKRLQLLPGHNSLKTTSIYLHLAGLGKKPNARFNLRRTGP